MTRLHPMIVAALLLAAPLVGADRANWYDCLDSFAQTNMFGLDTTPRIISKALAACKEELNLLIEEMDQGASFNTPVSNQIKIEQDLAVRHMANFINRYRPK